MKERGEYVGFTYPAASTHTCFNADQDLKLKRKIDLYLSAGLQFERGEYFRGNLSGKDFGVSTFRQSVVQWCPDLIITANHKTVFNKKEPWGLTMDAVVALPVALRDVIPGAVFGLNRVEKDGVNEHLDLYSISNNFPDLDDEDHSKTPLAIDGNSVPISQDIWRYKNGVILCSQRLGKLLSKFWDGLPDVKFQPVICTNFSKKLTAQMSAPLSDANKRQSSLQEDIRALEKALQIEFPKEYLDFLMEHQPSLPMGWLSMAGGINSMIMRVMKQEQQEAQPPMPSELVPIYAYGNGDYICLQRTSDGSGVTFMDWSHEDGSVEELFREGQFEALVESLE